MHISQFDFHLPEERIASTPAEPRDSAKMLCVHDGRLTDAQVRDLPDWLQPGDALVLNNTRVIPARLHAVRVREGGARAQIEFTLTKRENPNTWQALARPAKRLKVGDTVIVPAQGSPSPLTAQLIAKGDSGSVTLTFNRSGNELDEAFDKFGFMPLPPYIAAKRAPDETDNWNYQTMFAVHNGAVAAPTAGLHFTPELMEALTQRGVSIHFVTLHVGMGTFLPVKTDDTRDHVMHSEWGSISAETADALNRVKAQGGRVVAVGTTSVRVLETAACDEGKLNEWGGDTAIFITPGYRFKVVDVLMTNFHLPRSTLFMLVSAFAGLGTMRNAYTYAVENGYRFYSYGDATLLFKSPDLNVTQVIL
jgi:S-adenosylmethionine:tRNA ribosyltransferase-isomerase